MLEQLLHEEDVLSSSVACERLFRFALTYFQFDCALTIYNNWCLSSSPHLVKLWVKLEHYIKNPRPRDEEVLRFLINTIGLTVTAYDMTLNTCVCSYDLNC